jgi:hypothetical protein
MNHSIYYRLSSSRLPTQYAMCYLITHVLRNALMSYETLWSIIDWNVLWCLAVCVHACVCVCVCVCACMCIHTCAHSSPPLILSLENPDHYCTGLKLFSGLQGWCGGEEALVLRGWASVKLLFLRGRTADLQKQSLSSGSKMRDLD